MELSYHVEIRSDRFPLMQGEEDELVNPGTEGKALALFLKDQLTARGYTIPFVVCEDFGWWIEIQGQPIELICGRFGDETEFCCYLGGKSRGWSWRKLAFEDRGALFHQAKADLLRILREAEGVEILSEQPS